MADGRIQRMAATIVAILDFCGLRRRRTFAAVHATVSSPVDQARSRLPLRVKAERAAALDAWLRLGAA